MTSSPGLLADKLATWLQRTFPDARDVRIAHMDKPGGGFSNETWLLDVHWTRQGVHEVKLLVLRMQPTGEGTFPDYDLSLQYRCMQALAGTGVPVPEVLAYGDDTALFGVPFYLMSRIDGVAPIENPPYHQTGWLKDMTAAEQSQVWRECLDVLVALSRVDWQGKGLGLLDRPENGATPLAQMLHEYRHYLDWVEARGRPYPLLRQALAWAEQHQPAQEPIALCWGDAKLGNCLYQGTRCVAALDWEKPHLGNPVSDLAWCLMLDRALSTAIGIERLPGFWSREDSRAHWCEHSGFSAEHLAYYEFLSAFKFGVIMASITRVFIARGWVSPDTDMDLHNAGTAVLMQYAAEQGVDLSVGG